MRHARDIEDKCCCDQLDGGRFSSRCRRLDRSTILGHSNQHDFLGGAAAWPTWNYQLHRPVTAYDSERSYLLLSDFYRGAKYRVVPLRHAAMYELSPLPGEDRKSWADLQSDANDPSTKSLRDSPLR